MSELDTLDERLAALIDKVNELPTGDVWGAIESEEEAITEAVLRLRVISWEFEHPVPFSRRYMWADGAPCYPKFADGRNGRDFAIKVQITISSPDKQLATVMAAAPWARGRRTDPAYDARFGLEPLDDPQLQSTLVTALTSWRAAVLENKENSCQPPAHRAKRLAVLLRELCWDINHYGACIFSCERALREMGAFAQEAKTDRVGNLLGKAGDVWSTWAPSMHGFNQRLTLHLKELLGGAVGIAADLRFGMGDEAGPFETRLVTSLKTLHRHFATLADNHIGQRDLLCCGYVFFNFDGLYDKFRQWWQPLSTTLQEAAVELEGVALDGAEPVRPKPRMKREVAEPMVLGHLGRRPHDTAEDVAEAVGCSTGVVKESLGWKANRARLKDTKKQGKDPIALRLTDYLTTEGDDLGKHMRSHREEEKKLDDQIEARLQKLYLQIKEYRGENPDADSAAVAHAVGCERKEVVARDRELAKLIDGQKTDERESHQEKKPIWTSKP